MLKRNDIWGYANKKMLNAIGLENNDRLYMESNESIISTSCVQNAEMFNAKAGGRYNTHSDLKD
jgi:hypothetical protein